MAKDAEIDRTQIFVPVGSYEEVKAMGAPVRNIATCSEHDNKNNMGCPMYEDCDREWRGQGRPRNESYRIVTKDGTTREGCAACFHNVRIGQQVEANGGLFDIIGGEGDKYRQRGSRRVHPKRDPECHLCMNGECTLVEELDPEEPDTIVPPYPSADKHPELRKYRRARDARKTVTERDRERRRRQILGPDPVTEEEYAQDVEPAHEADGSDARRGRSKPR